MIILQRKWALTMTINTSIDIYIYQMGLEMCDHEWTFSFVGSMIHEEQII